MLKHICSGFFSVSNTSGELIQQIVVRNAYQTGNKEHSCQAPGLIFKIEFPYHPYRIRTNPETNGEIVEQFNFVEAISPCNVNGKSQSRNNHYYAQFLRKAYPAKVFDKPEQDVKVLNFPDIVD